MEKVGKRDKLTQYRKKNALEKTFCFASDKNDVMPLDKMCLNFNRRQASNFRRQHDRRIF